MNLQKLMPWNWFKHEENQPRDSGQIPVAREQKSAGEGDSFYPGGIRSMAHHPVIHHPILKLHQEIDRLFDSAFSNFGFPSAQRWLASPLSDWSNERWLHPNIDVAGDNTKYEITLDLPGLTEKDVEVEVRGDTLVIKGEKQENLDNKDKKFYRVERRYDAFQRTLSLPDDAAADAITATLKNGVLTLDIPRREANSEQDVKRITIRH